MSGHLSGKASRADPVLSESGTRSAEGLCAVNACQQFVLSRINCSCHGQRQGPGLAKNPLLMSCARDFAAEARTY